MCACVRDTRAIYTVKARIYFCGNVFVTCSLCMCACCCTIRCCCTTLCCSAVVAFSAFSRSDLVLRISDRPAR